jgi:hypothetical protein
MFLAAVLAETFEEYADEPLAEEAGRLLQETLTRHGYRLAPVDDERTASRIQLNEAALSAVRRFAGIADALARDLDRAARAMAAMDVEPDEARRVEDAAWHSIWLHGSWREVTTQMTTGQKEAAAAAVERHWYVPGDSMGPETRAELRWWEK